jgi:hypothetical protein
MANTPGWSYCGTLFSLIVALALAPAGCGKDKPSSGGSHQDTGTPVGASSAAAKGQPQLGADGDDDPRHRGALPNTGDVPDWVKTRGIRVVAAENVGSLTQDADMLAAIRAFRVASVASCRYNQEITSAEVLFIQASTPADAFGLLSVLIPNDVQTITADRSIRAVHMGNAAMRMAAQQGTVCVVMDVAGRVDLDGIRRSARRLMDSIMFSLPATDPPLIMQAIAGSQQLSAKVWLVRNLAVLARVEHPLVRRITSDPVGRMIGLAADATLSIAAVPATDKAPACLIWLAEYPTPDAAKAAHGRCKAASRPTGSSRDLHLTVLEPKGSRLAGVWTEQATTTVPLLKNLEDTLPR